jgi:putative membrane protein
MVEYLPLISTLFIVLSAILVAIGWRLILQGKQEAHQKMMVAAAVAAVLFFTIYLSRTLFLGNTEFGGPDSMKPYYLAFLLFHIVLATVSAVMGIITLTLAYKGEFLKHRRIGRPTAVIWFLTAITGVAVYYLLYIKYPGETTNLWDAIF